MTGRLYYDLNDKEDDYACKPLRDMDIEYDSNPSRVPIIMVDRGNCSFVQKTRNVQNLGGRLAVIVDNVDEDSSNIMMIDDGTASDILIPTVLISKKDGEKMENFMIKNKQDPNTLKQIIVGFEFKMVILFLLSESSHR